jgi:outer membrane biosynthesis protein TonB
MLLPGDVFETCFGAMNWRQIIPGDMTASALAHLSLLALIFLFSEVHPFGAVTAEPIAVDIVASRDIAEQVEKAEVEKAPEPVSIPPPPQPSLENNAASAPAPAAKPAPPARPQKQAALNPPPAATQPAPPPQASSPTPAYTPPEPDITVKYNVLLGLPPDIAPTPPAGDKSGDNFDAPATKAADVTSSVVAEFRRHLRTCSKLPASLKDSDDVKVRLRVLMTPQGKLAAEPVLIEASASAKGPLLMQSAISALQACQPYAMLPVDRYGEWKVLDLSFTPRDFAGS